MPFPQMPFGRPSTAPIRPRSEPAHFIAAWSSLPGVADVREWQLTSAAAKKRPRVPYSYGSEVFLLRRHLQKLGGWVLIHCGAHRVFILEQCDVIVFLIL